MEILTLAIPVIGLSLILVWMRQVEKKTDEIDKLKLQMEDFEEAGRTLEQRVEELQDLIIQKHKKEE